MTDETPEWAKEASPAVQSAAPDWAGQSQPVPSSADPVDDKIFQQTPAGATLKAADSSFGLGWLTKVGDAAFKASSDVWNAGGELGLSEQTLKNLGAVGWRNDFAGIASNWNASVVNGLLKPAAIAGDAVIRGIDAAASGATAAAFQAFGGSPDTNALQAQDFTQFLFINAGFSEGGAALARNTEAGEASVLKTPDPEIPNPPPPEVAKVAEQAPAETPVPAKEPIIGPSGNLNLKYINEDSSVKDVLADTAQAYAEKNGTTIPRVQSIEQARGFLEDAMRNTANGVPDFMQDYMHGDPINRNLVTSARELVVQAARDVVELNKVAEKTGDEADINAAWEAYGKLDMLTGTRHEMTAEAGRTLEIHKEPIGGEEGPAYEALASKLKEAGVSSPQALQKLMRGIDTPQKVAKFVQDIQKPTFGDMAVYYIKNNFLSGPITHLAYAASYTVQSVIRAGIETPIASLVGKIQDAAGKTLEPAEVTALQAERDTAIDRLKEARSAQGRKLTAADAATMAQRVKQINTQLKNAQTVMPKEAAARFYGMGQGYLDAVKLSWEALKSGTIGTLPGEKAFNFGDNPIVKFGKDIDNPLLQKLVTGTGKVVGIPMRVVGAIHTFQKSLSYSESLNALAYRQAASEGLEGSIGDVSTRLGARIAQLKNDPPPEMMGAAIDEGKYASLMGETGVAGRNFEKFAASNNYTKTMIPFARVMNNINSQALLERSPLGVFSQDIRDALLGRKGNAEQATAIGRMATGNIILGGAATLTALGFVNGEAPDDKDDRAFAYLSGNPPYTVRIGDWNMPLRFLGIPGRVMAIGADVHDVAQEAYSRDGLTAAVGLAAHAVGNNVLSESGFRGIADLYDAVKDYDTKGKTYFQNAVVSMFTPGSVGQGQLARAIDPDMRQAQTLLEQLKANTPFVSEENVPKIDIFGNPMLRGGDHSWAEKDPVMQSLDQLAIHPAPVGQRLSNIKLSEEQYADYATKAGKLFYLNASQKVTNPSWVRLSQEDQANILWKALDDSRRQARAYMHLTYPELSAKGAKQAIDLNALTN